MKITFVGNKKVNVEVKGFNIPVWNINEYVIEKIELVIHLPAGFPAGFDNALVEVAKRCLVARHVKIAHDIRIERDPAPAAK